MVTSHLRKTFQNLLKTVHKSNLEEGNEKDWNRFLKADQKKKQPTHQTNRTEIYLKRFLFKLENIQGQKGAVTKHDDSVNDW